MQTRAEKKLEKRDEIVIAASRRIQIEGLSGATIPNIMKDAGVTQGTFYAHFEDKTELMSEALTKAMDRSVDRWVPETDLPPSHALALAVERYLSPLHRDRPETGCPLASLCSELPRTEKRVQETLDTELTRALGEISDKFFADLPEEKRKQETYGFLALCVGSLALSRATGDPALSNDLLEAAKSYALNRKIETD